MPLFQTRHLPAIAPLSQGRLAKMRFALTALRIAQLDFPSKVGLAMKASVSSSPQLVVCMASKTCMNLQNPASSVQDSTSALCLLLRLSASQ